jgi:Arc/MetJ-type ribon-helix-helix transcriptional regulator
MPRLRQTTKISNICLFMSACYADAITHINGYLKMANTFHVSVPEAMEHFIEKRVKEKSFRSRGSYVQELIRQDQLRSEKVKLTHMLLVGLASEREMMTRKKWNTLRSETVKQIANKI